MRGTAAIRRAPPSIRRFTHSEIGGRESSIKPPSMSKPGLRSSTNARSSWNSRTPRGSRLPCPTTRSAGLPAAPPFSLLASFFAMARFRMSVLLLVYERVQGCCRNCRATFRAAIGDRGYPTLQQLLLGLGGADEADRQPDYEHRVRPETQKLEQRRGR